MRKWLVPLGVTCLVVIVGVAICAIAASLGIFRLAQTLPTPAPTAALVIGRNYWVNSLIPPPGMPAGLVIRDANIYNKPGNPITDPSITIIAIVPNATELTLTAVQADWCYVQGTYNTMNGINIPTPEPPMPTLDFTRSFEGWVECNRILDYEPTPYPTQNQTPQAP